ncbi:p-hydroxylaminobenzoate lyase [Polychaeton citri CBS 116435]|uniref:p-hydroxylaminobenzoate lyase n=1 Tax=Polychaeton citri CBS 116435 TaxID=1314669 RepID=A0A9P4UQD3_9PEZI|nr:p-hydroxylaminobenzoate lyase [Polychaeton citri CBS 116435]
MASVNAGFDGSPNGVDLEQHPTARKLANVCDEFFDDIQNLTPGHELEERLNREYGPGNKYYEEMCSLVRQGLKEGWVASGEVDGRKYRRGKIMLPKPPYYLSITTVYMESDKPYSGQYHKHPYGEINCVVQVDSEAELEGFQGWRGAGWTSPAPGTHHFPRVRNGALVALFFLPAGRIAFDSKPGDAQPHCV